LREYRGGPGRVVPSRFNSTDPDQIIKMSLYFTLLFALLTVEMAVLFVLVLPLPNKIRKLLYNTYQRLYHNQQVKTVTIILSIIVGLLFIDSWKRAQVNVTLYRHQNYIKMIDWILLISMILMRWPRLKRWHPGLIIKETSISLGLYCISWSESLLWWVS